MKNQFKKQLLSKITVFLKRAAFPVLGLASLIWFLIRVIPKPGRAAYPCMKVAFPIASGFVTWLLGVAVSVAAFKIAKRKFLNARYVVASAFVFVGLCAGIFVIVQMSKPVNAGIIYNYNHTSNDPMGVGQGIFPGRVVWAWNPDATNENQTGYSDGNAEVTDADDYWFLTKNNDQGVIDDMLTDVVINLTGKSTLSEAWDVLFKFHNQKKYGAESPYIPGQKIFIKINATSITQGDGGHSWSTWEPTELRKTVASWQNNKNNVPDIVETSPQIVLSVLRQLVNEAGVQEQDIYIGDPMKNVQKHLFIMWKSEFPNINVLGNDMYFLGLDLAALDRVPVKPTSKNVIFYSDKGTVMNEANADSLYTIHEDADYLINIASLKAHAAAGITLCAKNHFGSQQRAAASHLHKGLVGIQNDKPYRFGYGIYRVQVDLMAHSMLGGNTMLFLVDGLYSAIEGWTGASPVRWEIAPFNGDFTNSIFGSLDPVAIESACFDLLRTEYNGPEVERNRPNWAGVDDYLHQAADATNWPKGIVYDPDNNGDTFASLGVHEHWNNATDMKYSRDLGTGEGIELIKAFGTASVAKADDSKPPASFQLKPNYPNPFNATTIIAYDLTVAGHVVLSIYNVRGELVNPLVNSNQPAGVYSVQWNGNLANGAPAPSGMYVYQLSVEGPAGTYSESMKMTLQK